MARIRILAVGKIKENYIEEGIREYMKRMRNKRIETIEVKDSDKEQEGKEMIKKLEKLKDYLFVVLDEHGEELTSEQFAKFIKTHLNKDLCFVIGGPDGLDRNVIEKADKIISLSRMTFNHEMTRLFLIEQLYRGFSIIEGKTYHRR
jgi:23S rRNA (pseudouridine1915-N3)-methyltransferase